MLATQRYLGWPGPVQRREKQSNTGWRQYQREVDNQGVLFCSVTFLFFWSNNATAYTKILRKKVPLVLWAAWRTGAQHFSALALVVAVVGGEGYLFHIVNGSPFCLCLDEFDLLRKSLKCVKQIFGLYVSTCRSRSKSLLLFSMQSM
jgi:hypothetical protein